jgi:NhaP-type Na+/H+ or K+/H+ antiporter
MFAVLGTTISALCIAGILYVITTIFHLATSSSFQPNLYELLTFGALISATDPVTTLAIFQVKCVDPQLFYLVFGESVLNDAVGLILFEEFRKLVISSSQSTGLSNLQHLYSFIIDFSWIAIGSPILGILMGVLFAFIFKCIDMRDNSLLELALFIFLVHVPYLLGQLVGLSGIVVILFSGMAAKTYVTPNLSEITNINSDYIFRLVAFLAETAIFMELGLSVLGLAGSFHLSFTVWAIVACLLGRAANVYPLTALHNWTIRRKHGIDRPYLPKEGKDETTELLEKPALVERQISIKTQRKMFYMSERTPSERGDLKILPNTAHMLWFAGLRGAVAYACVRSFPNVYGNREAFTMTTMMIILTTIFVLGSTTVPVLNFLDIETDVSEDAYMNTWSEDRSMPDFVIKIEKFIENLVKRKTDDEHVGNDDVFVTDDNRRQNSDLTGRSSGVRRSSTINAKTVQWESQGIYDYGMD